jgi:transposase
MTNFDMTSENAFDVIEFDSLIEIENDKNVLKKLYYLRLRSKGLDVASASDLINIKKSTAYHIDNVWKYEGYEGLFHKKGAGRRSKLNEHEFEQLGQILSKKEEWLMSDLLELVKNEFGAEYSYQGLKKLLKNRFDVKIANYFEKKTHSKLSILDLISESSLDELEIENLVDLMAKEKNLNVFKKITYILFKKLGFSTELASYILNINTRTGNNWDNKWKTEGYEGLIHKKGQGRKPKLSVEDLKLLKKKLEKRDDWLTWEIQSIIKKDFHVNISYSHTTRLMREKFKAKFGKPYTHDYRRSPYYKQSFYLKLYHKLKKFKLKYDPVSKNITNLETNDPFLMFSFDESSQQLSANNIKTWSLKKPRMAKNTEKVKSNAAGFYSLTPEGKDYLEYLENSKAITIAESFKNLRKLNPKGVILLLIDNFPSHTSHLIKNLAEELNIELLFLPTYSPQVQPEEKVWHSVKRFISQIKIDILTNLKKIK